MSLSDVRDGSNQDYFYQEGFRKEASTESPESDQDYYYQEGFEEETSTESPESYITREELESIYHTLLIIFYIALPVSFILLRCFTIENVPKVDLLFLFNALTFWLWIVWFFIIWATDLFYWPGQDWWPFGGF